MKLIATLAIAACVALAADTAEAGLFSSLFNSGNGCTQTKRCRPVKIRKKSCCKPVRSCCTPKPTCSGSAAGTDEKVEKVPPYEEVAPPPPTEKAPAPKA